MLVERITPPAATSCGCRVCRAGILWTRKARYRIAFAESLKEVTVGSIVVLQQVGTFEYKIKEEVSLE